MSVDDLVEDMRGRTNKEILLEILEEVRRTNGRLMKLEKERLPKVERVVFGDASESVSGLVHVVPANAKAINDTRVSLRVIRWAFGIISAVVGSLITYYFAAGGLTP